MEVEEDQEDVNQEASDVETEEEMDGVDASELTPEALFEKNLKMMEAELPRLHKIISAHKPISTLEFLENGEPSVRMQDTVIYPEGAVTEARQQVKDLSRYGMRFLLGEVGEFGLDPHAREAYVRMQDRFNESGIRFTNYPTRDESFFLIVIGIGLAQHLDELVERTRCRVILLLEPNLDLLYHSLSVYDWEPLIMKMRDRGSLEFLLTTDTRHAAASIKQIFRQYNPIGYDGTTVFRHYRTVVTDEIERELVKDLATAMMGLGFFEDEINMVAQTYKSLESGTSRIISRSTEPTNIPALIVAGGPSFDELVPFIKKVRDRVMIFGCGTAILNLLEAGIEPDVWMVLERVKASLVLTERSHKLMDTSNIRVMASSTIFPGVTEGFKEAIYFFRPGLAPAPIFSFRDDQIVRVPDPLAANAGLACALHLGFRECYLAGADVGSKHLDRSHSKGGFYRDHEEGYKLGKSVPGNFGGVVWTDGILEWSRTSFETLAKTARGRVLYNLSDGALIHGITPLHYKAAKLKPLKGDREELIEAVIERCPTYSKAMFTERWEKTAIIDRLPEYTERLKAAVLDDSFTDFLWARELSKLLVEDDADEAIARLLRGTIYSFCISFEWFNNRLADPSEREVILKIFKEEYEQLMDSMCAIANEQFQAVENGVEWEQFEK